MWWWLFPHNEGLFLIMRKWTLTPERWLDAAMLVLVVALFVQGYYPDFKTYRSGNVYGRSSFLWPCVTGVSFLAAYYPFRWAYRLLWIAIAPYAVLAIPMLGFELKQRLNVASGEERWEQILVPRATRQQKRRLLEIAAPFRAKVSTLPT